MDRHSTKGLRLLSLDGGGVRGLASLLILKRIMYNLDGKVDPEVERPLLPCTYFDMIAGTSTGGLIALMLGVLRMDIDTCISKYLSMVPKIFPEEGFLSSSKMGKLFKGVRGKARFNATDFENVIKEMVSGVVGDQGEDCLLETGQPEEDPPQCRTFVCVTNKDVGKPFRLRNFRSTWEPGTGCTIWQAARATSAAPLYFPPIRFGVPPTNYVDGGLNYNNPVRSLYDEAKHVWSKSRREIKCIISIGTGVPPLKATGDTGKQLLESIIAIATDTQRTADEFASEIEHLPENAKIEYFRLNVDRGLEKMKLEEWKDFNMLTGATSYYLNNHKVDMDGCANALLDSDGGGGVQDSCSIFLSVLPTSSHAFFGRTSELSRLRKMVSPQPGGTGQQRAVLWGLGGFGKTRIALEYLKIHQEDYSAVLWINAATYESAEESFAQAATELRSRHVLQSSMPSAESRVNVRLVLRWLASSKNKDWLMVLDSLDDLESFDCRDLLPQCSHGTIMVTSTLSRTMEVVGFRGLEISGLDLIDGCEMLLSGMGVELGSDKEIPTRLIRAMNGVPLAIEQARAMIKEGMSVRDFLRHYETQYQRIMAQKPARSAWDYEKNMSIISVFNMLLSRLDQDGDAENILAFASCFGPRPVAVNLMGQVHQPENSTVSSHSDWPELYHTHETTWLNCFRNDQLAFQLASAQLERLCLLKVKRGSEGSVISISLHDSISRWRFQTLASDLRDRWIIAAGYALSKCLPEDAVDHASQMRFLPLISHFYKTIRRYIEPQKLEAPNGELCNQYGYLMTQFAHLYLDSTYTVEGECVFLRAIEYRALLEESSWPEDRRSLLLLKGQAMMFSKNGKMEDAAETIGNLHDASMRLLGPEDEITSWAAARLSAVRDRKMQYAKYEQRAAVTSQGPKLNSTTPERTPSEPLQSLSQDNRLVRVPDMGPLSQFPRRTLLRAAGQGDLRSGQLQLVSVVDENGNDKNSETALLVASFLGQRSTVQRLLDHGANVNWESNFGATALQEASRAGRTAVVDILLSNGADVNARSGSTALIEASRNGHDAVVQLLLDSGADVNTTHEFYGTALQRASGNGYTAVVDIPLSIGADVNARSHSTALFEASQNGHDTVVQLLLDSGADVNNQDGDYGTALQRASGNGHTAVVEILLIHKADVNARHRYYGTALHNAAFWGHYDIVQLLLDSGADVDHSALDCADRIEILKLLMDHGGWRLCIRNESALKERSP